MQRDDSTEHLTEEEWELESIEYAIQQYEARQEFDLEDALQSKQEWA